MKHLKKIVCASAAAVLAAAALTGCGGGEEKSDTIKIGTVMPISRACRRMSPTS